MQSQLKKNEMIFNDQITLLKPLGYNYVSFYHQKYKMIVIFHPGLKTIIKSYEVEKISDYSFREDRKYFYTITDYSTFNIYQIIDDKYYLLTTQYLKPIGFQGNNILCINEDEIEIDSIQSEQDDSDISYDSSREYFSDTSLTQAYYYEMCLVDMEGIKLPNSGFLIKQDQEENIYMMDKFYILSYENNNERMYEYYKVMINNKPSIKYHLNCDKIIDNIQLKYSNFYLTRIQSGGECILIMTKFSKNCKIIRKIRLQDVYFQQGPLFNYRQIISFQNSNQKSQVKLINLWKVRKQEHTIDRLLRSVVITRNTSLLVSSYQKRLQISRLQ